MFLSLEVLADQQSDCCMKAAHCLELLAEKDRLENLNDQTLKEWKEAEDETPEGAYHSVAENQFIVSYFRFVCKVPMNV